VVECFVEIGGEVGHSVGDCQRGQFLGVAADQDWLDGDSITAGKDDAAVVPDREHRPDQMLAVTHPAGYPIHDHSDSALCHVVSSVVISLGLRKRFRNRFTYYTIGS